MSKVAYSTIDKSSPRGPTVDEEEEVGYDEGTEKQQLVAAPGRGEGAVATASASGIGIKLFILICVTLQNTAYALVRRYSRASLHETYSTSSVLFAMEISKLVLSAYQIVWSGAPSDVPAGGPCSKYMYLLRHSHKMTIPAGICEGWGWG